MPTWWKVPPMWKGRTVAILASGPSMSPSVISRVVAAGLPAIVINNSWRLHPKAEVLYAADQIWWETERPDFQGLKVTAGDSNLPSDVHALRITGADGFDPDPECVRTGGNSGYAAVHLAAHAGASRILLFGFDMRPGHWHGDHPRPLRNAPAETYDRWVRRFAGLSEALKARGVEVINCTPGSALTCFPVANIAEALQL